MERKPSKELGKAVAQAAGAELRKDASDKDQTVQATLQALASEWQAIADKLNGPLADAALADAKQSVLQVSITDERILSSTVARSSIADSGWTLAHLFLLSKFSMPRKVESNVSGIWEERWKAALGEGEEDALQRFLDARLLILCSPSERLASKFQYKELKVMLRERGLKLAGRKDEMAERLCSADPTGMEKNIARVNLLKWSEEGRQLSSVFFSRRDEMQRAAAAALQGKNPELACRLVCEFQDALGFPENPMFQSKPDLADVTSVFSAAPKILAGVKQESLEYLRIAAGMAFLGLEHDPLTDNLETGIRLAGPAAVKMIFSYVQSRRNFESWRSSGLVRTVRIVCSADGPCKVCARLSNRTWPIKDVPEIPYEHCTSDEGCKCGYILADLKENV